MPGVTTAQTATQSAASRPLTVRKKHHHSTSSRRIRSPFYVEKLQIDVSHRARSRHHHLEGFPRWIKFDADEASVSFAQNSRKPPFSLGLQSLLEFLLHKIGVPRVSHRVHETDAVSYEQLDKTVVHGVHAVGGSNLNQSWYLRKTPVPDTRLDSGVHGHQFGCQDQ